MRKGAPTIAAIVAHFELCLVHQMGRKDKNITATLCVRQDRHTLHKKTDSYTKTHFVIVMFDFLFFKNEPEKFEIFCVFEEYKI